VISRLGFLFSSLAVAATQLALAQGGSLILPKTVEAGVAFSIPSSGNGKATLYIVGPGQVLKRDVQLGETIFFPKGSLYNAGHYLATLATQSSTENGSFDILPANTPINLSLLRDLRGLK